jgi:MraZ protein
MLRGNSLARVDEKGRLKVPSLFRAHLETLHGRDFFVTSLRGECVRIYPAPVYADIERRLAEGSSVGPLVTRLRNNLNYFGQVAAMDGQGRILIHPLLRQKAAIEGEVAVLGQQTFLEIWNHAQLAEQMRLHPLSDEDLTQLAALGF